MEKEDVLMVQKRLKDEACAYVKAGLTLHQFFAKYENQQPEGNLLMLNGPIFNRIWENYSLLKEVKKPKYSMMETMEAYIHANSTEKDG